MNKKRMDVYPWAVPTAEQKRLFDALSYEEQLEMVRQALIEGEESGLAQDPECRVSFRDTCGCILCRRDSRTADRLFFAAAALRSERDSTKRPPSPTPPTNGWTACRMPLQIFSAGSGKHTPPPLRKSVRALRLPRTTGLRVALHGRQRLMLTGLFAKLDSGFHSSFERGLCDNE